MFGITDRILWISTGIFVAILLATLGIKYYQVNSLKAQLAESKLQTSLLANAIEISNKSIEQLGKDSAKAKAVGAQALKKEEAISTLHQKEINRLHDALDDVKTCEEAVEIAKGLK